jgi:hypothetical protein
MAIVLFSNALTSEERKQTNGNGAAIRPLFAPSATKNVADTNLCLRRRRIEKKGTCVYTRVLEGL